MSFSKLRLSTVLRSVRQCSSFTPGRLKLSASKVKLPIQNRMSYTASKLKEKSVYWLDDVDNSNINLQNLMEPYIYVVQTPKQNSRWPFLKAFNLWMKIPEDKLKDVETLFGAIYDYMVMFDDMLDNSELRRRRPTVHRVYGTEKTMLSCNTLIMLVLKKLMDFENPEAIRIFQEEMVRYYSGQNREISWLINFKCPTVSEYFDVISEKTQCGYNFLFRLMQTMSDCKEDFSTLTKLLSLYYQFQNDYCNLHQAEYWEYKGYADDISEGKFTLPIIHAANSGTHEGVVVLNIVRQRTKDVQMKKLCLQLLEKLGSLEYARQIVVDTEQQLRAEIDRLGGNEILHQTIDMINLWKNDENFTDDS